ncbi:protein cueball-like isoform X2 [Gigantopelta aegis]|uniref:protein cueball-like isoform X2 n=1 Tax=Gigantopelta aegis TaxID=1735272 RepID=UPI001B887815|nr:protein cueball-like isoform X2 [Gigantopelta aegis]
MESAEKFRVSRLSKTTTILETCHRPSYFRTYYNHGRGGQKSYCREMDDCTLICRNNGCLRDGRCECVCDHYWTGQTCEVCSLTCVHGYVDNETCTCVCEGNWAFDQCDFCNQWCYNDGTINKDYCRCDCRPNFYGSQCDTVPDYWFGTEDEAGGLGLGTIVVIVVASLVTVSTAVPLVVYFRNKRNTKDERSEPNRRAKRQADNPSFSV